MCVAVLNNCSIFSRRDVTSTVGDRQLSSEAHRLGHDETSPRLSPSGVCVRYCHTHAYTHTVSRPALLHSPPMTLNVCCKLNQFQTTIETWTAGQPPVIRQQRSNAFYKNSKLKLCPTQAQTASYHQCQFSGSKVKVKVKVKYAHCYSTYRTK